MGGGRFLCAGEGKDVAARGDWTILGPTALHVQQEGLPHVEVRLRPDDPPCRGPGCVSGVPKRTANTSQPCGGHFTDWDSQEPRGISAVTGLPQTCDISLGHWFTETPVVLIQDPLPSWHPDLEPVEVPPRQMWGRPGGADQAGLLLLIPTPVSTTSSFHPK